MSTQKCKIDNVSFPFLMLNGACRTTAMKRIIKTKSSAVPSSSNKNTVPAIDQSAAEELLDDKSTVLADVKEEVDDASKSTLAKFKFQPERKSMLTRNASPKKRQHIKLEHDIPPTKIKKEPKDDTKEDISMKSDSEWQVKGAPLNWEVVLNNLRDMRKNKDAPVDHMGSQMCRDEKQLPEVRKNYNCVRSGELVWFC